MGSRIAAMSIVPTARQSQKITADNAPFPQDLALKGYSALQTRYKIRPTSGIKNPIAA